MRRLEHPNDLHRTIYLPSAQRVGVEYLEEIAEQGKAGLELSRRERTSEHVSMSRSLIHKVAWAAPKNSALILGAGNCTEIPLDELTNIFRRLTLVDRDELAMRSAVEQLPESAQKKVTLVVEDITNGAVGNTILLVDKALKQPAFVDYLDFIVAHQDSIVPMSRRFYGAPYDFVCSSLVMSQLGAHPFQFIVEGIEKFGMNQFDLYELPKQETVIEGLGSRLIEEHIESIALSTHPGSTAYVGCTTVRFETELERTGEVTKFNQVQMIDVVNFHNALLRAFPLARQEYHDWERRVRDSSPIEYGRSYFVQAAVIKPGN